MGGASPQAIDNGADRAGASRSRDGGACIRRASCGGAAARTARHRRAWRTHAVTAVEFGLYALLAPAVPLLVRRRADALLVLGTLVAWTVVASTVGILQWAGWRIVDGWPQGDRQPSFLGPHDFAALSG